MTPELQKQLAEYLKALMDVGAKAGGFAADQLPLIVQEKILYGRVSETLQLLMFMAIVYASYRGVRWGARTDRFDEFGVVAAIISGIVGVLFLIFTMIQTTYVAMVWLAPRLYIIEWASKLATGK